MNSLFENIFERRPYSLETQFCNTSDDSKFTIINNELVLESVDPTALNDKILTIDDSGLVSFKDEAIIVPTDPTFSEVTITNDLTLNGILQDDTEDKILVLDSVTNKVEFRDANSIPGGNPFNQDLNTFNQVTFDKLTLKQSAQAGSVELQTDNLDLNFFQQPSSDFNTTKTWKMSTVVNDTAETFDFRVENRSSFSGTKVNLTLNSIDQRIIDFDKRERTNGFKIGHDWSTDEMILGYGPDNNIQNGRKITLNNSGDVILSNLSITNVPVDNAETRILVLDTPTNTVSYRDVGTLPGKNVFNQDLNDFDPVQFDSVNIDGFASIDTAGVSNKDLNVIITPPASSVAGYINFEGESDNVLNMAVKNRKGTANSHIGLSLQSDTLAGLDAGGNMFITMGDQSPAWSFGRYKADNTFQWQWGNINNLQNTGDAKMKLSNTGVLTLNRNIEISAPSDSIYITTQNPATTTGIKSFTNISNSADGVEQVVLNNNTVSATAHSIHTIRAQLNTGNMCTRYFNNAFGVWVCGYQQNTGTFKWNFDGSGNDYLTNNANTKMTLDNSGRLIKTDSYVNLVGGSQTFNFPSDNVFYTITNVNYAGLTIASGGYFTSSAATGLSTLTGYPTGTFRGLVSASFNITQPTGLQTDIECNIVKNGIDLISRSRITITANNVYHNCAMSGLAELVNGDNLSLQIKSYNVAGNFVIGRLRMTLVH